MFDPVAMWKYAGILGTLIAAGFGFPIPEEIPIVTAGALVGHDAQDPNALDAHGAFSGAAILGALPPQQGGTRWWIMLPICILGVVFGDCVLYFAGRWFGPRLTRSSWVQRKLLPPDKRAKIEANFEKRGVMILLAARFTPGIRTPVFIMAGILRMPVSRFLLADGLYAIPGVNMLFWLAYWFTDQFVEAVQAVDRHRPMAVAAVLAAVGGVVLYKFLANRKISTGDPEDISRYVKPVGAVTQAVEEAIEKTVGKTIETAAIVIDKVTHPLGHGHGHGHGHPQPPSTPTESPLPPESIPPPAPRAEV
jgi:membrane protein DedA with SNARE-associated domain